MRIVIAGGHGQIARHLERRLVANGHDAVGMVRNDEQAEHLRADGVEPVHVDLEATDVDAMADVIRSADAVVFAAGGGPDGNAARKETVDKGAAIMLADAAKKAGIRRYVMVSAIGTENADPDSEEIFEIYRRAKQEADDYVRSRDLDWTIVKPGKLTDDDATGTVAVGDVERGEVTRADVADVLAVVLETDATIGKTFGVVGGDTPVAEAVGSL